MPPLPFSSSGGVVVVVVSSGAVVASDVVVVSVGVEVVVSVLDPVVVSVVELVSLGVVVTVEVEPPLSPLPAITTTAITRPTMTAIRPAISSRMLPCGRCSSSGWRIIRVGSSCIRSLLRSEYRVEYLAGVGDVEATAQALGDLLAAAPRDRHLGGEQAGAGGARARPGRGLRPRHGGNRPQVRLALARGGRIELVGKG